MMIKKIVSTYLKIFLIMMLSLICSSCSQNTKKILHYQLTKPQELNDTHTVKDGETLYFIAWKYGVSFLTLAQNNSIQPPYTIYPEQKISLKFKEKPIKIKSKNKKYNQVMKKKSTNRRTISNKTHQKIKWQWPAKGNIIRNFSLKEKINKGIDINNNLGEPVVAASDGKVVFAGNNILGYGNLIIIQHNDRYLSAYAHNKTLFVKEGVVVKAGQKIAETGLTGTTKPMLHFEIRRDGKPIDPMILLPKR